jgi:uncharacterized protein (DUF58 family)
MLSSDTPDTPILTPELMAKLDHLELVSRKIFRGRMKGERRSKRKGQSVEFADFRNYVAGDDLRFIDWNLYARLDRLYLKLFLEEEDLHFFTIIDDSPSMNYGSPTKLFAAKQIAAGLSYIGLCRGDRVRVSRFSTTESDSPVLRGRANTHRLINYVSSIQSTEVPSMTESIKRFCIRNSSKGIVVVITDLMDKSGYEPALRLLVARELDIYVIHLLSPEEVNPTSLQGDLKLVDCEDGDQREVTVSQQLMRRYRQTLDAFVEQAKSFCNKRSITYVPAQSDQATELLIAQYLRQRGLIR